MADGSQAPVASVSTAPAHPKRRLRLIFMLLGPVVLILAGLYIYLTGGRYVGTDNAYVKADTVTVSADVAGRVTEVLVADNQVVAAGTPLFRLDSEPFEIAMRRAEAELDRVAQSVAEQKAALAEAETRLAMAEENVAYAARTFERQEQLRSSGVASGTAYDDARHARAQAEQEEAVARQEIARLKITLGGDADTPLGDLPDYRAAMAAYETAALDLRRTEVAAPVSGVVTNLAHLQVGEYLQAGAAAFSMVRTDAPWIEANLKETDLTTLHAGQKAEVTVDAYPGEVWSATVDSISPATGAEFSLLPAQNATGNWVKVVQRVPVRLVLEQADDRPALRAGMSVNVEIDTEQRRDLPTLISSAFGWTGAGS